MNSQTIRLHRVALIAQIGRHDEGSLDADKERAAQAEANDENGESTKRRPV